MIERAVVLRRNSEAITSAHLQLPGRSIGEKPSTRPILLEETVEQFRREHNQKVATESGANKSRAARVLRLSRSHFSELVKKMGLG